ncbi:MAG: hypothetical protein H0T42_00765 [Deltaproteobacteria bacterium]|nr:hypothetical protein [Deltaproteobacteria bacterium]
MSDDAQRAREELAAEAARLAAKRRAENDAQKDAASRFVADREQLTRIEHPGRLRAALFRGLFLILGVSLMALGPFLLFVGAQPGEDSNEPGVLTANEQIFALGVGSLGIPLVMLRVTAIARSRRWRAKLPFETKGFEETFGLAEYISIVSVTVVPRDIAIERGVLAELLTARLPESEIVQKGDVFEIRSPRLETEQANWRPVNWYYKLVRSVLLDVNRGYPIKTVFVAAHKTTEFYVPSGD